MHKNNDQAGQQAPIQSAEAQLRHVLSVATSEMGLVHEALDLDPAAPLDALEMVKAVKALKHELWCAEVNLDGAKEQLASTVPAGWRLVPITAPTYMLQAMRSVIEKPYNPANHALMYKERHAYTALLNSAPPPPAAPADLEQRIDAFLDKSLPPAHALTDAEIDAIAIEFEDYSEDESSYFDHRKFARALIAHLARKG